MGASGSGTTTLARALADLWAVPHADADDFCRIGELPLAEWVFHLSLAYAGALDERAWNALLETCQRDVASAPRELISSVDFVWYDGGGEHIESFPLQSL